MKGRIFTIPTFELLRFLFMDSLDVMFQTLLILRGKGALWTLIIGFVRHVFKTEIFNLHTFECWDCWELILADFQLFVELGGYV